MGMSRSDFLASTLPEFRKTWRAWRETRETDDRRAWEVMRLQTAMILQPFVKGKLDPRKILPLPWDRQSHGLSLSKMRERRRREQRRLSHYLKTGSWEESSTKI